MAQHTVQENIRVVKEDSQEHKTNSQEAIEEIEDYEPDFGE